MTTFSTEDDLRTALREEASQAALPGEDIWVAVRRRIFRRRRYRAGATLLVTAGAAAVVVGLVVPTGPSPSRRGLMQPVSYQQACSSEPNVCQPGTTGALPAVLYRTLHLPGIAAGQTCPVTPGGNSSNPYVTGQQYGAGPVWMELGDRGDPSRGISVLGNPNPRDWHGLENVWLVAPGYQGPFTVRGARIDGQGTVGFGGAPTSAAFVEPPGPDPNSSNGWRFPPGTIWVTTPGCYAFQIDGTSFSEIVVIDMQAQGSNGS
jgi:hypothetical protein